MSTRPVNAPAHPRATARGVLASIGKAADGSARVTLRIPHTDYEIRLAPTVPPEDLAADVGAHVSGTIEGRALRIHAAAGGGLFIEPVIGEPRIVAGRALAVDEPGRRVLVDVAVPIWLATEPGQDFGVIVEGGLVNCYVASGMTFTPTPRA